MRVHSMPSKICFAALASHQILMAHDTASRQWLRALSKGVSVTVRAALVQPIWMHALQLAPSRMADEASACSWKSTHCTRV